MYYCRIKTFEFFTMNFLVLLPIFWLCVSSSITVSEEPVSDSKLAMESRANTGYCLNEHNAARKAAGKIPLNYDKRLETSARRHSNTMSSKNCFSHQCPGEKDLGDRIKQAGYTNVRGLAENIAVGPKNCRDAVNAWMFSAGHKANILGNSKNIGCASASGNYWTCDFG